MNIFYNRDNYLKDRLNSYITLGNKNELSASKWMFFDKNETYTLNFEVLSSTKHSGLDYFTKHDLPKEKIAKILFLDLDDKKTTLSTTKANGDLILLLINYMTENGVVRFELDEIKYFFEYYLMNSVFENGFIERLSPKSYTSTKVALNKLVEVNSLLTANDFPLLFDSNVSNKIIEKQLEYAFELISSEEVSYKEWKLGRSFNNLTLDYGRYYVEYCHDIFSKYFEVAHALSDVYSRIEQHLHSVGLELHKNTRQLFLGILSNEDITQRPYKKYAKAKVDQLKELITEDYKLTILSQLEINNCFIPSSVSFIAKSLGVEPESRREDHLAKYQEELDRLKKIIYYHLVERDEEIVRKLLEESRFDTTYEAFCRAVEQVRLSTIVPSMPTAKLYESLCIEKTSGSKSSAERFIRKIKAAGTTQLIAICGWRGSEFGFPLSSIRKVINEDPLDQYTVPYRVIVKWYVYKQHADELIDREITHQAYMLINKLASLNDNRDFKPAIYSADQRTSSPNGKSVSHAAMLSATQINWLNYVKNNPHFIALDELEEYKQLIQKQKIGNLNDEQKQRLRILSTVENQQWWANISNDPNLVEAKRRAELELDRVMFRISIEGEMYKKSWLLAYRDYLISGLSTLSQKIINLLTKTLSNSTKDKIRDMNDTQCSNKPTITQISNEIIEGCLYPTTHGFRHMWAEAVYRRFDGDAGWMIRSQFKHISKSMWLAYIRDKDNRRRHDAIKVNVMSSIAKNWIRKSGAGFSGKFHKYLHKVIKNTAVKTQETLDSLIDKLAKESLLSIKANAWGFCILRKGTMVLSKCFDGLQARPENAKPSLCLDCINNITHESHIDYIVLITYQHIDLLNFNKTKKIPTAFLKESISFVTTALKRIKEIDENHEVIPVMQQALENSRG